MCPNSRRGVTGENVSITVAIITYSNDFKILNLHNLKKYCSMTSQGIEHLKNLLQSESRGDVSGRKQVLHFLLLKPHKALL